MSYNPLQVSNYFDMRVRDWYPVPESITLQLYDHNYGIPDAEPEWHVSFHVEHEHPWEAPWGRLDGPDFSRMLFKIATELEAKFGVKFPRKKAE